jgi:VanZ family protein
MPNKPIIKVCGVAAFVLLVFAALGPSKLVPRSGLGWELDHFFSYFAMTLMFCLVWPRPIVVGGAFVVLAALLEGLQAFTPDRTPDLQSVLFSAAGTLSVVLNADLFIRAPRLVTQRTLVLMLQQFARLDAPAALMTVSRAGRLLGIGAAFGVAPAIPSLARTAPAVAPRGIARSSLNDRCSNNEWRCQSTTSFVAQGTAFHLPPRLAAAPLAADS